MTAPIPTKEPYSLLNNSRFYVLSATIFLSLVIFFGLHVIIVDSRLRDIRLQQIYGLCAVSYWYFVLLMSAGSKLIPKKPWVASLLFTRRAFGVGVAYFATLHFILAITKQLDGWHGIWLLPTSFKFALLFGAIAMVVLWVMALLSIDKLVKVIHFRQWKWLGRISYIAGLLVVVHVWIIGTHTASLLVQLIAFQALVLLFGCEAARIYLAMIAKKRKPIVAVLTAVTLFVVLTGGLWLMRGYVPSYSNNHSDHLEAGTAIHAH